MDADETRIRAHVQRLAGDIGQRNVFHAEALHAAQAYLEQEWRDQGYEVRVEDYEVAGVRCANLEATRRGHERPAELLLAGAHYDTVWGSPGANDNGSGVAALLELSRLFAAHEPRMSVRFVAFVNEEPPFFVTRTQGSIVYARAARARGDDIRLMLSLETIGCYRQERGSQHHPPLLGAFYPDRGNFVALVSDFGSARLMRQVAAAFRAHSAFPLETLATFRWIPGVDWSDHRSFWKQGYRALMVTDTALYRDRNYHSRRDTPDQLSYPELARVTDGLWGALRAFADGEAAGERS
jgi:Zn-dependent M28 family amino/carboxypeptidase